MIMNMLFSLQLFQHIHGEIVKTHPAKDLTCSYLNHRLLCMVLFMAPGIMFLHESIVVTASVMTATQLVFAWRVSMFNTYNGYGVAREVNAHLGKKIIAEHALLLKHLPTPLWSSWLHFAALNTLISIAACMICALQRGVIGSTTAICAIYAWMILCAEVYVWFAVDYKRQWHLYEGELVGILSTSPFKNTHNVYIATEKLREQRLLSCDFVHF